MMPPSPSTDALVFASADAVTRLLLTIATLDDRNADAFVARLFDIEHLAPVDRSTVYQAVRQAVASMPLGLWLENGMQKRQDLLAKFDQLAAEGARGKGPLPDWQMSLEEKLRRRMESSLKPLWERTNESTQLGK
jgi:hypothetical protein